MPLVSISLAQRRPLPGANFVGNVYHGLPPDHLKPASTSAGGYLAFPASMRSVQAVPQLLMLDRSEVRSQFLRRFSSPEMTREYVGIYQKLCQQHRGLPIEDAVLDTQTGR